MACGKFWPRPGARRPDRRLGRLHPGPALAQPRRAAARTWWARSCSRSGNRIGAPAELPAQSPLRDRAR